MQSLSDHEIRAEIYRQFTAKLPRAGLELEDFILAQCEYFEIDQQKCRRFVAFAQQQQLSEIRAVRKTAAQELAETIGDCKVKAIETLVAAMDAGKYLLDKDGNVRLDPQGNPIFQPNWGAKIRAAEDVCEIFGMYAPKQVQLEANHHHAHTHDISTIDLRKRLAAVLGVQIVDAEFGVVPGAEAGSLDAPGGDGAAESGDGLLLLAEKSHRDG